MDRKIDDNEKQKMKYTAEAPICKGHIAHTQFGSCSTQKQLDHLKNYGCARDMNRNYDSYQHDKCTAESSFCHGYVAGHKWG